MSNATWKMGAEVRCVNEQATVPVPTEEYQTLIEAKVKLEVLTRLFESGQGLSLDQFNAVTGYEIQRGEDNGDTV